MNKKDLDRVKQAMLTDGVPPSTVVRIVNSLLPRAQNDAWLPLMQPLHEAIRVTSNARVRWRTNRKPVYEAYLQLMHRVQAEISHAARTYDTPADAAKAAAKTNAARELEGRRPLGSNGPHWSTWVPPHIVEATCLAFEAMYADEAMEPGARPGRRITPFSTLTQRTETQRKWERLIEQARLHIEAGFDLHPAYIESSTRGLPPEHARSLANALVALQKERYRAAFAARKVIQDRIKRITTNFTVPLHWTHVLDEDTRARLREAERNAGGDGYTREIGIMGAKVPMADARLAPEEQMRLAEQGGEHEGQEGPDSHGYIAPRPEDRFTAMAARAQEQQTQEQARLDAELEEANAAWRRRVAEGDL